MASGIARFQLLRQVRTVKGEFPDQFAEIRFLPIKGQEIPAFYADSALAEGKKRFPNFLLAVEPVGEGK